MSKLEQLLSKEMSRQQFLVTIGMAVVSLFGFSTLMGILTGNESKTDTPPPGYGHSNYGP